MLPQNNAMVNVDDLARINDQLRKSAVGYATPSVPDANAPLSPLVPQSIEDTLSVATFGMSELALWPAMPKTDVKSTLHEYVVAREHGADLDPFIGEGGGGSADFGLSQASYEKKAVKVKFMAERRQVSDVASMVGLIGDNREAIAEETMRGTIALMGKVESQLFHGDESLNPEGFDGIIKQIKAAGKSHDLLGSTPTAQLLAEVCGEAYAAPNYGRPDTIFVEPRIHSELIKQSIEGGRHDQLMVRDTSSMTFGVRDIAIMAPYGEVKVKAAPFLFTAHKAPLAGFGEAPFSGAPAVTFTKADDASSNLEAGDYIWKVVAVGKKGMNAPVVSASISVDGSDKVTIALPAGANCLYWRIYRSEKNGSADTCKQIARVAQGVAGAEYVDLGQHKYNASSIVFAQTTPDAMSFFRLLDFLRRPLASVETATPFLLALFGSPQIKLPQKCFVLEQAVANNASGLLPNYLSPNH